MPPAKTRIALNLDSEVAMYLEEKWRESVDEANRKGEPIPSFSRFLNDILTRWAAEYRQRAAK